VVLKNIIVSAKWAGCGNCCLTEQGPFFTHVRTEKNSGTGMFFAGSYGALERHEILSNKLFFVDAANFFAARDDIKFKIGLIGGLKQCCCSGELFVMKFRGPCVVFTRSRDPSVFNKATESNKKKEKKQEGTANALGSLLG